MSPPETSHEYLHAKIRVGSCKNAVTYKQTQKVFHHDDIPARARERVSEVKEYKSSKILSESVGKEWNSRTALGRPVMERKAALNLIKDRSGALQYNFRAEVNAPKLVESVDKPSKFHISTMLADKAMKIVEIQNNDRVQAGHFYRNKELPNHPKLENATPWDGSSQEDSSLRIKFFNKKGSDAKINTMRVNKELNSSGFQYRTPIRQSRDVTKKVRELKLTGTFNPDEPVFRPKDEPVDRKSLVNRIALEPSRKYKTSHHSGVWEFSPADGRMRWSDTGSFEFESRGDFEVTHNPDCFNFAGPTLPPRVIHNTGKEKRINLIERSKKKNPIPE
jgi:hypothetical protein